MEAQLNCFCDDLVKAAVMDKIMEGVEIKQKLPLESTCMFIENDKQATVMATRLRYFVGKEKAKEFYAEKGIMDPDTFDTVNWDDI